MHPLICSLTIDACSIVAFYCAIVLNHRAICLCKKDLRLSYKGRSVDALAQGGDEGRGKLR